MTMPVLITMYLHKRQKMHWFQMAGIFRWETNQVGPPIWTSMIWFFNALQSFQNEFESRNIEEMTTK